MKAIMVIAHIHNTTNLKACPFLGASGSWNFDKAGLAGS